MAVLMRGTPGNLDLNLLVENGLRITIMIMIMITITNQRPHQSCHAPRTEAGNRGAGLSGLLHGPEAGIVLQPREGAQADGIPGFPYGRHGV